MAASPIERARSLGLLAHPWTRRTLTAAGLVAAAVAGMSYYGVDPGSGGPTGFRSTTSTAATYEPPRSTTSTPPRIAEVDPCAVLTVADVGAEAGGSYAAGQELLRPDGSICIYARRDAPGEVSITLYAQDMLDTAVAQDPDLAYHDLRGLLERTRSLAELGSSTYVRSVAIGDMGYEIRSTDARLDDRMAVIQGDDLVVLAASDPNLPVGAVRRWMRAALGRLAAGA